MVKSHTWWHTAKKILWTHSASYSPRELKGSWFLRIQTQVVFSRNISRSRLFRQLLIIDQSPYKVKPPDSVFLLIKTPTDRNVFSYEAIIALKKLFQILKRRHSLLPLTFYDYLPFKPFTLILTLFTNSFFIHIVNWQLVVVCYITWLQMTNGIPISISNDSINITMCVSYHWQVQISIYRSGHCHDRVINLNYQNPSVRCFPLKIRNIVI